MKTITIYSTVLAFVLFISNANEIYSQNQFAFYKNGSELLSRSPKGKTKLFGKDVKVKRNKIYNTSNYYTYSSMPKEVLSSMPISKGMVFYSALEHLDGNTWLFVEREMESNSYNFCFYDHGNKTKKIIFSQNNSPDTSYAFKPIAWSKSKDVVYIEALIFGSSTEHEGIWSYNIKTKQFLKLSIIPTYLTTPVISPNGKYFIYDATTGKKDLDSETNCIYIFNTQKNKEKIIVKDKQSYYSIVGWIDNSIKKSDIIGIQDNDSSLLKKNNNSSQILQVPFKLPWNSGVSYYVSRTGTPAPSGSIGSTCYVNYGYTPHSYIAVDFDSPNGVYDPVRASAAGTVIFAGISGSLTTGYGRLVKIQHSDNTISYYAHLNAIYVSVNDIVQQGCEIGDGGTTGSSSGDHIHFEWRDVGDVQMTSTYPTFDECSCEPHPDYCYSSNNSTGNCTVTAPPNDACPGYPITSNPTCTSTTGTVAGATQSVGANTCTGCGCQSPDDYDVYYYFTAVTDTHTITIDNISSNFDAVIEIRNLCGSGGNLACYDPVGAISPVNYTYTNFTPGVTYYIRIFEYNYGGTPPSSSTFDICVTHSSPLPSNNDICGATSLTVDGSAINNDNTDATPGSDPAGSCWFGGDGAQNTLWYSFTAPASGSVSITTDLTTGTLDDTQLSLYSSSNGSCTGTLTEIGCDDDGGTGGTGLLSIINANGLTSGTTYFILLDGYNGLVGDFYIQVTQTCTVPSAATVNGNSTACSGTSSTYTASASGATSYSWSCTGTATCSGTGSSKSVSFSGSGTGTITATPSNSCGNGSSGSKSVTVTSTPGTPTISGNTTACSGTSSSYTASASGATSYSWSCTGTATCSGTGSSKSVSFSGSGTGTITATPSNSCGNGSSGSKSVTVTSQPGQASISGNSTACSGTSSSYSASASGATSYSWNCSGTASCSGTGSSKSVSFSGSGTGTITATPSNSCGNGSSGSKTVTITSSPGTATVSGSSSGCAGTAITFSASASNATSYSWSAPGWSPSSGSGSSFTTTPVSSGNVCVTPSNSCGTGGQGCKYVTVTPLPGTATVNGSNSVPQGNTVTYTASATNATSYSWTAPFGWSPNSGTGFSFTSTPGSSGNVTATPSNSCGNGSPGSIFVTVNPAGIEDADFINNLTIHPNPNTGKFIIEMELTQPIDLEIKLLNVIGQVIYHEKLSKFSGTYQKTIDIGKHAKGIYNLQLITEKGIINNKIIVE